MKIDLVPKITVLMPVFNCAPYIGDAINSILIQTYIDFEFIIVDDCSTDGTLEIIGKIEDPRIILLSKETNTGYTKSLNLGLNMARGEYIARMDGDDISLPERFNRQVYFMDNNPDVAVCGTWFEYIGEGNQLMPFPLTHDAIKILLLEQNPIGHPTAMIRKSILDKNWLRYDETMEPSEDYDLWIRLSAYGQLANIGERLLMYRIHDKQVSAIKIKRQNLNALACRLKGYQLLKPDVKMEDLYYDSNIKCSKMNAFKRIKKVHDTWQELMERNKKAGIYDSRLFVSFAHNKASLNIRSFFLNNRNQNFYTACKLIFSEKLFYPYFTKKEIGTIVVKSIYHSLKPVGKANSVK